MPRSCSRRSRRSNRAQDVAKQISLREFQQGLAQRLREAQTEAEPTSRLGVLAGGGNWLLKLDDAGEMLPLPEFSSVPLTKEWYLGLANIRGVLASIVDFAAVMGALVAHDDFLQVGA